MGIPGTDCVSFRGNGGNNGNPYIVPGILLGGAGGAAYGATRLNMDALMGKDEFIRTGATPTGEDAKQVGVIKAARGRDVNKEAEAEADKIFKGKEEITVDQYLGGSTQEAFDAKTKELEGQVGKLQEDIDNAEKDLEEEKAKTPPDPKKIKKLEEKVAAAKDKLATHNTNIADRKRKSEFATANKTEKGMITRASAVEHEAGRIRGKLMQEVTAAGEHLKGKGLLKFMPSLEHMGKWGLITAAGVGLLAFLGNAAVGNA